MKSYWMTAHELERVNYYQNKKICFSAIASASIAIIIILALRLINYFNELITTEQIILIAGLFIVTGILSWSFIIATACAQTIKTIIAEVKERPVNE